jgi:hypothetical protein
MTCQWNPARRDATSCLTQASPYGDVLYNRIALTEDAIKVLVLNVSYLLQRDEPGLTAHSLRAIPLRCLHTRISVINKNKTLISKFKPFFNPNTCMAWHT